MQMGLLLGNQSPEYEWDIPLRNSIAQWEGLRPPI
jgi:hypothetical protein